MIGGLITVAVLLSFAAMYLKRYVYSVQYFVVWTLRRAYNFKLENHGIINVTELKQVCFFRTGIWENGMKQTAYHGGY